MKSSIAMKGLGLPTAGAAAAAFAVLLDAEPLSSPASGAEVCVYILASALLACSAFTHVAYIRLDQLRGSEEQRLFAGRGTSLRLMRMAPIGFAATQLLAVCLAGTMAYRIHDIVGFAFLIALSALVIGLAISGVKGRLPRLDQVLTSHSKDAPDQGDDPPHRNR